MRTTFVFYCPENEQDDWVRNDVWAQLSAMNEMLLFVDRGGEEAELFGVSSSGHCLLFDEDRRLLFDGGLVADSSGASSPQAIAAMRSALSKGEPAVSSLPMVGCDLEPDSYLSKYDFFTNYGNYMPRIHCLQTAEGNPDWPWIVTLVGLNLTVLAGYIKIIRVWRKCYLAEEPRDRDSKLMDLAWIFFFCGISGYGISTLIFFWPAYRLLALFLLLLAIVTWRFAYDLRAFEQAFTVRRLGREVKEELQDEIVEIENRKERDLRQAHREKLESIGGLAAGIAHEINTPLQFIGSNVSYLTHAMEQWETLQVAVSELLEDDRGQALTRLCEELPSRDLLQNCQAALADCRVGVGRVTDIIGAMTEFAYLEADDSVPFDVNHCIENAATLTRNATKDYAVVELDLGECQMVHGSASAMNQTFVNLIINASDAIQEASKNESIQGRITVASRQEGDTVVVRITDTGCGMDPQLAARAFEPFFTTKEVGKGSGQGLAIAHNAVVNKCGGEIEVDSRPGEGTTFTIKLPIARYDEGSMSVGAKCDTDLIACSVAQLRP